MIFERVASYVRNTECQSVGCLFNRVTGKHHSKNFKKRSPLNVHLQTTYLATISRYNAS